MSLKNPILDGSNDALLVTNYQGGASNPPATGGFETLAGLPLGTSDATGTGQLAVKVLLVGSGGGTVAGAVTIADGADVAEGTKTDTPYDGAEDATARTIVSLLKGIKNYSRMSNQFSIPFFDYQALTYYGSTNNVQTQTFKVGGSGGTTVGMLTYTYVGSGAANDDLIATITHS